MDDVRELVKPKFDGPHTTTGFDMQRPIHKQNTVVVNDQCLNSETQNVSGLDRMDTKEQPITETATILNLDGETQHNGVSGIKVQNQRKQESGLLIQGKGQQQFPL